MAITPIASGEGRERVMGAERGHEAGVKYPHYTEQQIETLEKVFAEFPNPNCSQRAHILLEQPDLNGIDNKQLKVWFENRSCREKQKKENRELVEENKKLALEIKVMKEDNDVLQNMVADII